MEWVGGWVGGWVFKLGQIRFAMFQGVLVTLDHEDVEGRSSTVRLARMPKACRRKTRAS